ncbi:hypothetical protein EUGRSUZ_G00744 [Eucalyptus grandis]|uniref:Uncharacterized protein n=2 Tax=Eucalyptus grandis TaxID=71139 RepID=A0ACC3K1P7_EUCGR|nr:hypothetical protein EUGRSUZ_G00744 [Eucalyptus grandis]
MKCLLERNFHILSTQICLLTIENAPPFMDGLGSKNIKIGIHKLRNQLELGNQLKLVKNTQIRKQPSSLRLI